jgi:hypothetical protein
VPDRSSISTVTWRPSLPLEPKPLGARRRDGRAARRRGSHLEVHRTSLGCGFPSGHRAFLSHFFATRSTASKMRSPGAKPPCADSRGSRSVSHVRRQPPILALVDAHAADAHALGCM